MKKVVALLFILPTLILTLSNSAQSQSKFGNDSIECLKQSSLYREFVKQKNYKDALPHWRWAYNNCPASSKNIYLDGVKIFSYYAQKANSDEQKSAFIDTLVLVYKSRIEYFGQEDFVVGRLGMDLLRHDPNRIKEAYGYLTQSVDNQGMKTEYAVGVTFMQASAYLYKSDDITKEETLADFSKVMKAMEDAFNYYENKGQSSKSEKFMTAMKNIETYFMESGAADCDVLIPYFTPKFNETPGDPELLKNMTNLLDKADCTDSDLYYDGSKQLHKIEPSASSAVFIARAALKREKFTEAVEFYKNAIELEQDPIEKGRYYYELGLITFSQLKDFASARQYAYKSIENDPKNGKAYILIGNLYASSATQCGGNDDFEQRVVYWAAVDKFEKAKKVDPSLTMDANRLIEAYSAQFPNGEILFFKGLTEGEAYTVGCWINEKTIIRKSN